MTVLTLLLVFAVFSVVRFAVSLQDPKYYLHQLDQDKKDERDQIMNDHRKRQQQYGTSEL